MLKVKRIMGDINKFNERELDKEGIYLHYNEDNLQNMNYLIIGPDETPKLTILPFGAKHLIPLKKVSLPTES